MISILIWVPIYRTEYLCNLLNSPEQTGRYADKTPVRTMRREFTFRALWLDQKAVLIFHSRAMLLLFPVTTRPQSDLVSNIPSSNQPQKFMLRGELQSPNFLPWVERHSRKLGLRCETLHADPSKAVFKVDGQVDLIDAFEVGCLLGPYDVWVESITRGPATSDD